MICDIELFQNIANLLICAMVFLNLYVYFYINHICLSYSTPFICTYFCYDFFLTKKTDVKIHHIFIIMLIVSKFLFQRQDADDADLIISLYHTEISSVFYVIKLMKPYIENTMSGPLHVFDHIKNGFFQINDIVFFATFFKYRIYDYYTNVIVNTNLHNSLEKYTENTVSYILLYGGLHGMFILNSYWFTIICKILCKQILKNIPEETQILSCHRFVSYTLFVNCIIGHYVYSSSYSYYDGYIVDMIGISVLSYSSYMYHTMFANTIVKKQRYEYTSNDSVYLFLNDMGCIHFRAFLCVAASYYVSDKSIIICICFLNHLLCYSITWCVVFVYKMNKLQIYYDKTVELSKFLSITNFLTAFPTFVSICLIAYNTSDIVTRYNIMYSTILCGLILGLNPAYEMSHCFFHIGLLIQTYYLALSNIEKKT